MSTEDSPLTAYQPSDAAAATAERPTPGVTSRTRRLLSGIVSAVLSRGLAALAPLLLVPVTFGYLGTNVYGLWMAVLSLTSMAVWADLGLGNGLMTRLSHSVALSDVAQGRRLVASSYALVAAFATVLLAILALLVPVVPWETVFNITDPAALESAPRIAFITIGAFLINVPISLIQRIQYAHQEVTQSNVWVAVASLASVVLAWVAVRMDAGVLWVVGAVAIGPILGNLCNTVWFFLRHPEMTISVGDIGGRTAASLFGLGGRFLLITLMSSVALNADTIVVAHTSGLATTALFSVTVRAMTALGLLVTIVNTPLWPAHAEALAKNDLAWVERTTRRMALASGLCVLLPGLLIGAASARLFSLWLGSSAIVPDRELVFLLVGWWMLVAATSPFMMVLNAAEFVRPQIVGWSAYLLISIPAKFLLGAQWGPEGVVIAGIAVYLGTVAPTAALAYRQFLQQVSRSGSPP